MKLKQISVFLENKPGQLLLPCQVLSSAGINIQTLCLADTQQFGILRIIVEDWKAAKDILEKNGCVVKLTEVVAIEVEDRPGGLARIIDILDKGRVNIEYMYAFTFGRKDRAVLIFRFDDPDSAVELLREKGIGVVGVIDFFKLAGTGKE